MNIFVISSVFSTANITVGSGFVQASKNIHDIELAELLAHGICKRVSKAIAPEFTLTNQVWECSLSASTPILETHTFIYAS